MNDISNLTFWRYKKSQNDCAFEFFEKKTVASKNSIFTFFFLAHPDLHYLYFNQRSHCSFIWSLRWPAMSLISCQILKESSDGWLVTVTFLIGRHASCSLSCYYSFGITAWRLLMSPGQEAAKTKNRSSQSSWTFASKLWI